MPWLIEKAKSEEMKGHQQHTECIGGRKPIS